MGCGVSSTTATVLHTPEGRTIRINVIEPSSIGVDSRSGARSVMSSAASIRSSSGGSTVITSTHVFRFGGSPRDARRSARSSGSSVGLLTVHSQQMAQPKRHPSITN